MSYREIADRIFELKTKLKKTDYKAIKYAEGELTTEEYASTLEESRAWRAEINELQTELRDKYATL